MRKRRAIPFHAAPAQQAGPIVDLNTTPLIDVMLVLLIMFIITVPIMTHKVAVDLPQGVPPANVEPKLYRLNLDAMGGISLDGRAMEMAELQARLNLIRAEPDSTLLLQVDGATPYDRFDHVMATVKRAGIAKLGMVGNERFVPALD